ncbi:MAG TPA: hypothetical protein VHC22_23125 [Pirellulales bacterium]|nr:hypothetical protein [Pirellulales bacterium]
MDENPYKAPRAFAPLPFETELARLRLRLGILKPAFAAISGLTALVLANAVCAFDASAAVTGIIFVVVWFVVGLACARTATRLRQHLAPG